MAAVVMVVVILVVGGVGYVALNGTGGAASGGTSPFDDGHVRTRVERVLCRGDGSHDVTLEVPFKSVQQGNPCALHGDPPNGRVRQFL